MIFSLSAAAALAAAVSAAPFEKRDTTFTAPVRQVVKEGTTAAHIVAADAARRNALFGGHAKRATSDPVDNAVVTYLADIGVGAGTYSLIIDTGSSNTWALNYKKGSASKDTGETFEVSYGSGSVSGEEYTDTVTLTSGLTIKNQGVGRGTSAEGFDGTDGILGVGPIDLTAGTTSGGETIPTVLQNAKSQGLISKNVLGVYFAPTNSSAYQPNGELTYGGTDSSKYTSSIQYTPVLASGDAAAYWGLSIKSSLGSGTQQGIVDTGTTLVYVPSNWFKSYTNAIPSAAVDQTSGLLRFPKSSLSHVPDVTFTFGSYSYTLNKYAQLVETGLYKNLTLSNNYLYSWIADSGSSSGLSTIIGQKFLERYYSVFDTDASRIGFANTTQSIPTTQP